MAGALALPLVLLFRHPLPTTRRDGLTLAFSGFAAFIAFPLLFTVGQARTSATHGALILATLPVFTSLFGTLVERRRVTAMWVVGCTVALVGEAAVIVLRNGGAASGATVAGDLVVLASSVICATGYVAGARLTQHGYGSVPTTLWGASGAAVALLPLMLWSVSRRGLAAGGRRRVGLRARARVSDLDPRLRGVVLGARARRHQSHRADPVHAAALRAGACGDRAAGAAGAHQPTSLPWRFSPAHGSCCGRRRAEVRHRADYARSRVSPASTPPPPGNHTR